MKISIEELTSILAKNEAYVYIRPDLRLQPYIAHYTITLSHDTSNSFLTLVPDVSGCLVMPRINKEFTCSYWGPTTKTVIVEAQQASKEIMMFVEFRPGGAYSLFHLPLHKVSDQQIPISDIFPVFHKKLEEAYHSSDTIQEFIHRLNDLFLSILEEKEVIYCICSLIFKTTQAQPLYLRLNRLVAIADVIFNDCFRNNSVHRCGR